MLSKEEASQRRVEWDEAPQTFSSLMLFQILQRDGLAYSPPFYPSPWMDPQADGWADAYARAKDFVSKLTLLEKVNLTTGVG
jgi:hypothetical protein